MYIILPPLIFLTCEVGWAESDWPKVIQLVFMPEVGLELSLSLFLGQLFNHYTKWFSVCHFPLGNLCFGVIAFGPTSSSKAC